MSDYVAKIYDGNDINHGDAVHYRPENAITDADLGYTGQLPDLLDNRLQFFDGIFAGAGFPGIVPDPITENGYFLRDDSTWVAIGGGGVPVFGGAGDDGLVPDPVAENGYVLYDDGSWAVSVDETADYAWTGTHTFDDIRYTDTYWDDLRVPVGAVAVQGQQNLPDWETFVDSLQILCFDPAGMEQVFFTTQLPHAWKEGTDIEAHVHWAPAANGASAEHRARWGLEYTWANRGSTFGSSATIYGSAVVPDEQLVQNRHYVTELGDIDGTGKTISSMLVCRLFRDATHEDDDYTGDACLLEIDFHYQIDRPGSRTEYTK